MTTSEILEAATDPFALFEIWMAEAAAAEPEDPNAMALATTTPEGRPSVRVVLLKSRDRRGFVFYTNLESRKGQELAANPHAAVCFHWKSLRRQIRIEGAIERVGDPEADAYFAGRPRGSQAGAWASEQSRRLDSRATLEARTLEVATRFEGQAIPRPPFWSGFRVVPSLFEFWQDQVSRLHDRIVFARAGNSEAWRRERLYP